MKKKLLIFLVIIFTILLISFLILPKNNKQEESTNVKKIVTSFYPIYIMTQNIAQGAENVEVINLTQNDVGCLHDYTLSTTDMRKIEDAYVFIENGLGLENFMDKIIQTYPNLKIIDSSKNITNKIEENDGINPHIWTNIENYINQVETIAKDLEEYNPENAQIYINNCDKYIEALNNIKLQYDEKLQKLRGQKAIVLNESLNYLTKELEMDITSIVTNHEESTLSADTIKNIINKIKEENIKIIFIDESDDMQNAETLKNETDAQIYKLDSGLNGEEDLNSYIQSITENLEILEQIQ